MADDADDGLLDSINEDATQPQAGADGVKDTPADNVFARAGGRAFKTKEDLVKAHDSLLREYSRVQGEFSKAKPWWEFGSTLQNHPDLYKDLNERISEYHKRIQAGQSKTTAQQDAGLAPEFVSRVSSLEAKLADQELAAEKSDIVAKYKADEATMKDVLQYAAKARGYVSLDDAYWAVQGRRQAANSRQEAEKKVQNELKQKQSANVGGSFSGNVSPPAKDSTQMSRAERRAAILQRFRSSNQGS